MASELARGPMIAVPIAPEFWIPKPVPVRVRFQPFLSSPFKFRFPVPNPIPAVPEFHIQNLIPGSESVPAVPSSRLTLRSRRKLGMELTEFLETLNQALSLMPVQIPKLPEFCNPNDTVTSWESQLVVLSIVFAIAGSYLALDFASRMRSAAKPANRRK